MALTFPTHLCVSSGMGPGSKQSVNIALYHHLDLYANVVHAVEIPGLKFRHPDVDIVIVRENSEGIYSGIEYEVAPGVTVATKVMTRKRTRRIAEYAFEYAYLNNRTKVCVCVRELVTALPSLA